LSAAISRTTNGWATIKVLGDFTPLVERISLHANLDAFYASVELLLDPS
jgi:hypothetical protein